MEMLTLSLSPYLSRSPSPSSPFCVREETLRPLYIYIYREREREREGEKERERGRERERVRESGRVGERERVRERVRERGSERERQRERERRGGGKEGLAMKTRTHLLACGGKNKHFS